MKILMIGAHPDDNEFRCGGLAAKYVKAGHSVTFLSILGGSGSHQTLNRNEIATRRYGETRAVAKLWSKVRRNNDIKNDKNGFRNAH